MEYDKEYNVRNSLANSNNTPLGSLINLIYIVNPKPNS